MIAVIYARYSSQLQRDASIEDQVRLCRTRIEREGWQYLHAYTDRAVSGASALRPAYQSLLEDARRGGFDIVVAEALDRLSRDQEDIAGLFKRLRFAGVRLFTLAEGEITELHVGLKGTMNALFLKDLADKTRRGLEGRVRQGRSGGGLCYGYDVVREIDASGAPIPGGRRINPGEAAVVERIFTLFSRGESPRAIAHLLNREAVPGPGGRPWGDTTLRGHFARGTGILRNRLYIGQLVWNRLHYVKDPVGGKRRSRLNPPDKWIVEEVAGLRIIEQPLWDTVQERLLVIRTTEGVKKVRETRFWEHRRVRHLLTGKAFCGSCGSSLVAIGADRLACNRARRTGTCDNRCSIRRAALENLIVGALKDQLMAPELVVEFIQEFHREVNRQRRGLEQERAMALSELALVNRKLEGLIDAIADGLRAPGLQHRLDDLEARKCSIEAKLIAPAPAPLRLHPNLAELYRRNVAELHTALAAPELRTAALELIRGLVERVELRPAESGFEIELIGEIANMVALANGGGTLPNARQITATRGEHLSSVKVVAGARNQRCLQALRARIPIIPGLSRPPVRIR
jgi:DNA invertase Pin-like site-specific DNA recombinase